MISARVRSTLRPHACSVQSAGTCKLTGERNAGCHLVMTPICAADEAGWLTRLVHGYTLSHMFPLMRANTDRFFRQGPASRAAVSELPMSAA